MKRKNVHNIDNERLHNRKWQRKKNGGFTLIEVIAVIAIIGVMASVLLPKFTNYINEAKKLKVVEQSRKVIMAVECYNMKASTQIPKTNTVTQALNQPGVKKYFEDSATDTNKLKMDMSINDCYSIVNGDEFSINAVSGQFSKMGS